MSIIRPTHLTELRRQFQTMDQESFLDIHSSQPIKTIPANYFVSGPFCGPNEHQELVIWCHENVDLISHDPYHLVDSESESQIDSLSEAIGDLDLFDPETVNLRAIAKKMLKYIEKNIDATDYLIGTELVYMLFNRSTIQEASRHPLQFMFGRNSENEFESIGYEIRLALKSQGD